jgi:hypothetical protein
MKLKGQKQKDRDKALEQDNGDIAGNGHLEPFECLKCMRKYISTVTHPYLSLFIIPFHSFLAILVRSNVMFGFSMSMSH